MRRAVESPIRAVLGSIRLLGQALGLRLARQAARRDDAAATILELRLALARAEHEVAWLTARLARVPPRRRPHYTATERWHWLACRHLHGWSLDETARRALVTATTIARWERDASRPQGDRPPLARPAPPIRRFSDAIRAVIQLMDRCGVGGNALIARTLVRAGWRVSAETVRRIRRERPIVPPTASRGPGVIAMRPNHVWLIDLTSVPGLVRATTSHLAVILDAFSRLPLVWRVFAQTPTARQIGQLLQSAIHRSGRPDHLISDRGVQFTAKTFRRRLRRRGIRHRFGAVGRVGSIALIERFWRTLKEAARVRRRPPLSAASLEARLRLTLAWYTAARPHTALSGATPLEVYRDQRCAVPARSPPRGRRGDGPLASPFAIAFLNPDQTLPVLIRRAA